MDFNRAAHEVFFAKSSPEWKQVYEKARSRYNEARNRVAEKPIEGPHKRVKYGIRPK